MGMFSERTDPEVLGGRDGHGWASSRPPTVLEGSDLLIDQIVLAVQAGDDPAIRRLLPRLSRIADIAVLLRLRQRLYATSPAERVQHPAPCVSDEGLGRPPSAAGPGNQASM